MFEWMYEYILQQWLKCVSFIARLQVCAGAIFSCCFWLEVFQRVSELNVGQALCHEQVLNPLWPESYFTATCHHLTPSSFSSVFFLLPYRWSALQCKAAVVRDGEVMSSIESSHPLHFIIRSEALLGQQKTTIMYRMANKICNNTRKGKVFIFCAGYLDPRSRSTTWLPLDI